MVFIGDLMCKIAQTTSREPCLCFILYRKFFQCPKPDMLLNMSV